MCLIAVDREGGRFDLGLIPQIRVNNTEGVGFAHVDDGRVVVARGLYDNATSTRKWRAIGSKPMVAHFRSQTKGAINVENCHPFEVLSIEDGKGKEIFMFHNGTLPSVEIKDQTRSDTWHYAEYLKPLLKSDPHLLNRPDFRKFLGASIGLNKLVFIDNTGLITIINEASGKKLENGCWVSNLYSLKPKKYEYYSPVHGPYNGANGYSHTHPIDVEWGK